MTSDESDLGEFGTQRERRRVRIEHGRGLELDLNKSVLFIVEHQNKN